MPADNPFAAAFPCCHLLSERACDDAEQKLTLPAPESRHMPRDRLAAIFRVGGVNPDRTFFVTKSGPRDDLAVFDFRQRVLPPEDVLAIAHPQGVAEFKAIPSPPDCLTRMLTPCFCVQHERPGFCHFLTIEMPAVMLRSGPYRPDPGGPGRPGRPVLVNEEIFWLGQCPRCHVVYWTEKCLGPANASPVTAVPEPAVGEDVTTTELRRLLEGEGVGTDGGIYLSSEGGWRQKPSSN